MAHSRFCIGLGQTAEVALHGTVAVVEGKPWVACKRCQIIVFRRKICPVSPIFLVVASNQDYSLSHVIWEFLEFLNHFWVPHLLMPYEIEYENGKF